MSSVHNQHLWRFTGIPPRPTPPYQEEPTDNEERAAGDEHCKTDVVTSREKGKCAVCNPDQQQKNAPDSLLPPSHDERRR